MLTRIFSTYSIVDKLFVERTMADKTTTIDHVETGTSILKVEPVGKANVPTGHEPLTNEERALSRAVNRRMDVYLLPFLSFLYLFNGLDRGNVGNAETQGT